MNILIVEDEVDLAEILRDYLYAEHFSVSIIGDGLAALAAINAQHWDLILVDLMLPSLDGLSLCKKIRSHSQVPIIITTAKAEEIDRLVGLEVGADDYICKPFSPREVVARIKAVLRRSQSQNTQTHANMQLQSEQLCVSMGDTRIELTPIEFRLLETLFHHKHRIVSREMLLKHAYTDHRVVSDRTMDSHITKLRKKISPLCDHELIQSVYGAGYRLNL